MTQLSKDIYDYYCSNFEDLTFWKKLHFATRLYHWDGDEFSANQLKSLRAEFFNELDPAANMIALYEKFSTSVVPFTKNASELRMPIFEKYPKLRTMNNLLFRALVYMTTYQVDCREIIAKIYPDDEIGRYLDELYKDKKAVAILSTHAINAQYLYRRLIQQADVTSHFDPNDIYQIGESYYDLTDKTHLKLYIYLFTHCIIGESLFYTRHVPAKYMPVYLKMLENLEKTIASNYNDINLDNKCEFLTCCQILGVESNLRQSIDDECEQSVSSEGTFLVDTINNNPQIDTTDFSKSEHRNVLYIMANRTFRPHDKAEQY